jgi:dTMP kinase
LPLALIDTLESLATGGLQADLTLWLDVSLAESIRRRGGQAADRIEGEGWEFLFRVSRGFAVMAGQQGWTRIAAEHGEAAVTMACRRAMVRTFWGRA